MPVKSIFPSLGKKCGRREREADAKWGQREQSFGQPLSSRRSKAPWSSERWCPSRGTVGTRVLVGPSRFVRGLFPRRMGAPMTVGCSLGAEEGNVVSVTLKAYAPDARGGHTKRAKQGTRPSLGPKARARQSSQLRAAKVERRWRGSRGIAVGQTHGSGRNQHRGHGNRTVNARLATYHRFLRECSVVRERKGRRLRPPSLRGKRELR